MTAPLLRTSERKDFRRCPQRWDWRWVRGLRPTRSANALWFGSGMHLALAAHYRPGGPKKRGGLAAAEAVWRGYCEGEWRRVWPQAMGPEDEEPMQALELGLLMLQGYFNLYGKDSEWEVIAVETPFQIRVPFPNSNRTLVWYAGTYDLVMRNRKTGEFWLWDHKNVKSIDVQYLSMDDQAGSYLWVANEILRHRGVLGPDEELEGIIYNFLRKGKPDDRPKNSNGEYLNLPKKEHYVAALLPYVSELSSTLERRSITYLQDLANQCHLTVVGEVSKQQPAPLFHREPVYRSEREGVSQAKRVQAEALNMRAMRSGKLPLFKNPTRDCSWDCAFVELCELDEQGGDTEEFIDGVYLVDDPYEDHRMDMEKGGVILK